MPATDLFDVIQHLFERWPRCGWLLLGLLFLGLGAPTLLYPFGRDQAMFAYVGQVWRDGGLPYRDAWDIKLPAIYATYALLGGQEWAPRLLDLLAAAGAAVALAALERRVAGARPGVGVLAGAISIVFTLGALDFWNLAQAETLIAPLSAAAVVSALSRRWFIAGLLAGCAATFKTSAVLGLPPILAAAWLLLPTEEGARPGAATRVRPLLLATCGAAIPALFWILYFTSRGGLAFLWELIATQAEYAGGDPRLAGRSPIDVIRSLQLTGYLPVVGLSLVGLWAWIVRQTRKSGRHGDPAQVVIAIWWLTALAQVLIQRRFYLYHWTVLTPAAAWLAAVLLADHWRYRFVGDAAQRWRRVGIVAAAAAFVALAVAPRWPSWRMAAQVSLGQRSVADFRGRHLGVFGFDPAAARDAAAHVRLRSEPRDPLLVFGFEPEVYVYSGRRASTRHASDAPLTGETSIREARRRAWFGELMADLRRQPPLYIVERAPPRPRPEWCRPFRELLAADYQWEADYGQFKVFRRKVRRAGALGKSPAQRIAGPRTRLTSPRPVR